MGKFFKLTGIVLAGLLVTLVVVAVVLPFLVDANSFKPEIEQQVEAATGRDFDIEGDIELSVFPWLGLKIGKTTLGQPDGFPKGEFAGIDGVRVGVRLLPLLQKKLEVDQVELIAPAFRLQIDAEGRNNWDDLAGQSSGKDVTAVESDRPETPEIRVAGFRITGGDVRLTDASSEQDILLTDLDLRTGQITLPVDTTLAVDAQLVIEQGGKRQLATSIDFDGEVFADPDTRKHALKSGSLNLLLATPALDDPLPIELVMKDIAVDLAADTATIGKLSARVHELAVDIDATVRGMTGKPEVKGHVSVPEFRLREFLGHLDIELPPTRATDTFGSLMFAGDLDATRSSARFDNVELTFDESTMSGSLGLADIESQALEFDLAIDAVDVDRYLAPAPATETTEKESADIDFDSIELPRDLIASLNVDGKAVIGMVKVAGFRMNKVTLGVTAGKGTLRLFPLDADFYDGGYRGDVTLIARKDVVLLDSKEEVRRFQLGPMTRDVMDVEKLSGTTSLEVNVTSRGRTAGDWLRNMNGDFRMDARDGTIEGFNLWSEMRGAYAKLKQRPYDGSGEPQRTKFADLDASGGIVKGIIENDIVDARLPFLNVTGSGSIDPLARTLDYSLEVTVLDKPDLDAALDSLRGVTVPVSITGSLLAPKIRPEIGNALKQMAKQELDAAKAEARKKLEEKKKAAREEARQRLEKEKEAAKKEAEDALKDKLKDFFH